MSARLERLEISIISLTLIMLKGPKLEIFGTGVFTQIRPVWVGDLGTRPKNPKLGWLRPENRQFVLLALCATMLKIF
jgi:hypothetical protein